MILPTRKSNKSKPLSCRIVDNKSEVSWLCQYRATEELNILTLLCEKLRHILYNLKSQHPTETHANKAIFKSQCWDAYQQDWKGHSGRGLV